MDLFWRQCRGYVPVAEYFVNASLCVCSELQGIVCCLRQDI